VKSGFPGSHRAADRLCGSPGGFTGGGAVLFEGTYSPGASPAAVAFAGDVAMGASATLAMELGGTLAGDEYDRLVVAGRAELDGTLSVALLGQYNPGVGDSFRLIEGGLVAGAFDDVLLPSLPAGAAAMIRRRRRN